MTFDVDQQKSVSNKEKHGLDFHEAQYLWLDPERIVIPARTANELRYLMVTRFKGVFWSVIYTTRGEIIRIISVRKSRQNEKEIYQG
ncbi:MAG: BrnT family toxin [Bacteroidales bacterium]|nr:BrnT family toxin [Bacteroidales bacterium]